MKRFLSLLTAIIVPAAMLAPATTKADRTRDEFMVIVERTFNDSFTANSFGDLSLLIDNRTVLQGGFTNDAERYGNDLESHQDLTLSFDTQPLNTIDPSIPVIGGDFQIGADFFYQDDETFFWTRLRDMGLFINKDNTEGMAVKEMVEGYFELLKFFQNQYILLDLQEVIDTFREPPQPAGMEMMVQQFEQALVQARSPGSTYAEVMNILIDSGFVTFQRNGDIYTLTINKAADQIDPTALAEIFTVLGYPAQVTDLYRQMLTDNSEEVRETYRMIAPMTDAEIVFRIGRDRIRYVTAEIAIRFDPAELSESTGTMIEGPEVFFQASTETSINPTASRISFPEKAGIELTKFYRALKATMNFIMISSSTTTETEVSEVTEPAFETPDLQQ